MQVSKKTIFVIKSLSWHDQSPTHAAILSRHERC